MTWSFKADVDLLDRELVTLKNAQHVAARLGELASQFRALGNDAMADEVTRQRAAFVRSVSTWRTTP